MKIKFNGIISSADEKLPTISIKQTENGYKVYINGNVVPGVLHQKLVVGSGVTYVELQIAVQEYETDTIRATVGE